MTDEIERPNLEIYANQGNLIVDLQEGMKIVLPMHFYPPQPFLCLSKPHSLEEKDIPYCHTLSDKWESKDTLSRKELHPIFNKGSWGYDAFNRIVQEAETIKQKCEKANPYQ